MLSSKIIRYGVNEDFIIELEDKREIKKYTISMYKRDNNISVLRKGRLLAGSRTKYKGDAINCMKDYIRKAEEKNA